RRQKNTVCSRRNRGKTLTALIFAPRGGAPFRPCKPKKPLRAFEFRYQNLLVLIRQPPEVRRDRLPRAASHGEYDLRPRQLKHRCTETATRHLSEFKLAQLH